MALYFSWDQKTIHEFSASFINSLYNQGYVFTRIGKGVMNQTRSLRVVLQNYQPNSENRRVLKKIPELQIEEMPLPIEQRDYDWQIHKMGKDFYTNKFADHLFSAAKIKELVTDSSRSNFNLLMRFKIKEEIIGYVICYQDKNILHYAYPFYLFQKYPQNLGMSMMLKALEFSQLSGRQYFYLGSLTRPADKYKLQFSGIEWFDQKNWQNDLVEAKKQINVSGI
ncbi:MAG: hypothetical protein WCJ58_08605 [bacterium]